MSAVIANASAGPGIVLKASRKDFWLAIMLLCVSGNMLFSAHGPDKFVYTIMAIGLAVAMFRQGFKFDKKFLYVVAAFLVIMAAQVVTLKFFAVITILGFFTKLFIAYAFMKLISDFPMSYVRAIRAITLLSLAFWIPDQILRLGGFELHTLFKPIANLLNIQTTGVAERINIGIYNFQTGAHKTRNAALFWEPGAFAGYALLGIVFLYLVRKRITQRYFHQTLALLVFAVLTTQSTMGIIVLPFVLMLFVSMERKSIESLIKSVLILLSAFLLMLLFALAVSRLEFVGEKLIVLYERAANRDPGWHVSRIGAVLFDWEYMRTKPLVGYGQNNQTQYQLHPELVRFALGNGLTGFFRQMGILGMGTFIIATGLALRRLGQSGFRTGYLLFIFLLTLNGEYFLMHPMYLSLMFLQRPRFHDRSGLQVRIQNA